ncbi:MAG: phosphoribosyl-ATP diphosphatase [Hydrogenophilus sp.]|nr:phosphoribosyl-ATP diphosphatase [Hydrogenophilus sp.]
MIDHEVLVRLSTTLKMRKGSSPESSYVAHLCHQGVEAILKKIAEESAEVIMAAKEGERLSVVWEVTDLWFHTLVLLTYFDLSVEDVLAEFRRREGISGIDEKRTRLAHGSEAVVGNS